MRKRAISAWPYYSVLFCGPTGTGKSIYIQRHLRSLDKVGCTLNASIR